MQIMATVQNAWDAFSTQITSFIPLLIGAIIIFVVGWLAAKLTKSIISKLLSKLQLDRTSEKTGLKEFLQKG
ncbi:MAG: mechanosensitive ion channel family protein, partial [Desulfonatronovibrionaceae bacterium]